MTLVHSLRSLAMGRRILLRHACQDGTRTCPVWRIPVQRAQHQGYSRSGKGIDGYSTGQAHGQKHNHAGAEAGVGVGISSGVGLVDALVERISVK